MAEATVRRVQKADGVDYWVIPVGFSRAFQDELHGKWPGTHYWDKELKGWIIYPPGDPMQEVCLTVRRFFCPAYLEADRKINLHTGRPVEN